MGDKISQLTSAASLDGTELVPVVQSGATKKATAALFKTTNAADLVSGTIANARLPIGSTLAAGALQIGTTSGTACDGADSRLSNSRTPSGAAGGDLTGTYPSPSLAASGVTAGTYGSGTSSAQITVDAKGRVTNVSAQSIPIPQPSTAVPLPLGTPGSGTSSAFAREDHIHQQPSTTLTGDATGTGVGTVAVTLANSGVTQGTYGSGIAVPQITVDSKGRVIAAGTVPFSSSAGGTVTSVDVSGGSTGLSTTGGPVTGTGTITLTGTLGVANGGTGATAGSAALANLGAVPLANVGVANGIASLDSFGRVPTSQSPTLATLGGVPYASVGIANGIAQLDGSGFVPSSQLSITGGMIAGTVAIANGGTGVSTQQDAINALAGSTASGLYLRGDGTNAVMSAIQVSDIPTLNQNTTGTASNVTGTVAVANGGTGQTTAALGFNALAVAGAQTQHGVSVGTLVERATISATAATGTVAFDATLRPVLYYTSNASAAFTLNVTGASTFLTANGNAMTVSFITPMGATPYSLAALQIDGVTSGVTTIWQSGTGSIPASTASATNVFTFTIIRTAVSTYTVLGNLSYYK